MSNEILLAIYDLSKGTARKVSTEILGIGNAIDIIPHTSVVAFGREYYFAQSVGIQSVDPKKFRQVREIEPIEMKKIGTTNVSKSEFEMWCKQVIDDGTYTPQKYDLLFHNCNNFSSDAALKCFMFTNSIPEWILNIPHRLLSTPMGQMGRLILEQIQSTTSLSTIEKLKDEDSVNFQKLVNGCESISTPNNIISMNENDYLSRKKSRVENNSNIGPFCNDYWYAQYS